MCEVQGSVFDGIGIGLWECWFWFLVWYDDFLFVLLGESEVLN